MGDEIRRRLEASFEAEAAEPSDTETQELLTAISFLARQTTKSCGAWSKDPFAFQVLKGCIDMLMRRSQPDGDPAAKPKLTKWGRDIFGSIGEDDNRSPEEFSRTLFGSWLISKEFNVKAPPGHPQEMSKEEQRR